MDMNIISVAALETMRTYASGFSRFADGFTIVSTSSFVAIAAKGGGKRKKNHRGPVLITRIVALPYLPGSLPLFRNGIVPPFLFSFFFFKSQLTKILSSGIRRSNGWIR